MIDDVVVRRKLNTLRILVKSLSCRRFDDDLNSYLTSKTSDENLGEVNIKILLKWIDLRYTELWGDNRSWREWMQHYNGVYRFATEWEEKNK